jgi:hypothetical protein
MASMNELSAGKFNHFLMSSSQVSFCFEGGYPDWKG